MSAKKSSSVSTGGGLTDGVVNPSGFVIAGFAPIFAAFVPLTSYLAKPNGWIDSTIGLTLGLIPGAGSAGIAPNRQIAALAAIYIFVTFPLTGAVSAAAQASAREEGIDNNSPRAYINQLRGLPLRLFSAHYNIVETFPIWALAAALTQATDPTDQTAINLLGLAALTKIFVYYPAYVLDLAPLRTLSHVVHTSAVLNVVWRLAVGV